MRISGLGGGGECCKSTAGCPGVCTSHACPASCPGLPTSPRGPKPPYPPPAGLRLTGKQHRAGAGGFGMVGGGGWGGWRPLGPSPELGVVDQGAEGGGEGGRFALQPRRAGSGHGLPWGGRRRKAAQAGGRPAGLGRPQGGGRCAVRHGALLGKPGRQHRDQAARLSGRQREGERGGGGGETAKPTLAAEAALAGRLPDGIGMGKQACVSLPWLTAWPRHHRHGACPPGGCFAAEEPVDGAGGGEGRQAAGILEKATRAQVKRTKITPTSTCTAPTESCWAWLGPQHRQWSKLEPSGEICLLKRQKPSLLPMLQAKALQHSCLLRTQAITGRKKHNQPCLNPNQVLCQGMPHPFFSQAWLALRSPRIGTQGGCPQRDPLRLPVAVGGKGRSRTCSRWQHPEGAGSSCQRAWQR